MAAAASGLRETANATNYVIEECITALKWLVDKFGASLTSTMYRHKAV